MRTIQASEIGAFLFCERAWWYRKQGVESDNLPEMLLGSHLHVRHGRAVMAAGAIRFVAYISLLAAVLLIVAYLTLQVL
jgi:hypothetical protein